MDRALNPPLIAGLFSVQKKGQSTISTKMVNEIRHSLATNPWYREKLLFLAGDSACAKVLEGFDLPVYKVFDDAPSSIHREAAFRMKHWMVFWMLKKFGEVVWIDWDTINLIYPDDFFYAFCRSYDTPKFVYIPGYHATVNCSVYYVSHPWMSAMERSFKASVPEPNDELLWRTVLPKTIVDSPQFWWGDMVVNVWLEKESEWIQKNTYFAHVKTFAYTKSVQKRKNEIII
jgi:hypothetical protein